MREINLREVAESLAALEPETKSLAHLGAADRARVSLAISHRRIADAMQKIAAKEFRA